jgi:hypothetical protein
MNQEIKARWVEALRSGKYKQGKGTLRTLNNQYCCLGVLCDISGLSDWESHINQDAYSYCNVLGVLPDLVMQWADLGRRDPYIDASGVSLSGVNDFGLSFSEIADIIEEYL